MIGGGLLVKEAIAFQVVGPWLAVGASLDRSAPRVTGAAAEAGRATHGETDKLRRRSAWIW